MKNIQNLTSQRRLRATILTILIFSMTVFMLLPTISAEPPSSLGTFKQCQPVQLKTILTATWVSISTISYPNGTTAVSNQPMSKVGNNTFTYDFNYTCYLGIYNYDYSASDGSNWVNSFEITPSGNTGAPNIVFIVFVILLIYTITAFGYFKEIHWVAILGGGAMIFLGVYMINNGIIIYRDDLTRYVSYITSFLGAGVSVIAGINWIQENMD